MGNRLPYIKKTGFSLYKEVETDRRCSLDESILNSLMMIASNGPTPTEFRRSALLQSAIDIWYRAGERMVVLHDRGNGKPVTGALVDEEPENLKRQYVDEGQGRRSPS